MTSMPELVAVFNGLGGGASALVAASTFVAVPSEDELVTLRRRVQDAPKRVRTLEERERRTEGALRSMDALLGESAQLRQTLEARLDEARERAASRDLWNRDLKLALVDAASGDLPLELVVEPLRLPG